MPSDSLDTIDRRLLAALQTDNRQTIADLCDAIGLTPQTCHRRLKRLRESGLILREAAIIDPRHGARPLTVLIGFSLERLNEASRRSFEQKIKCLKEISMCWAVAGSSDFLAVGQFKDMQHYYDFSNEHVVDDASIKQQNTTFAIRLLKFDLEVEF